MYMDAIYPVAPAVEIDDRQRRVQAGENSRITPKSTSACRPGAVNGILPGATAQSELRRQEVEEQTDIYLSDSGQERTPV